ncbi:hypothetical protein QEN19_002516 [Hanseniaspora menglaensis]
MSDNIAKITHNSNAKKNLLFTCHACSLTFPSSDIQRYHMKSDWHRYNLKRKIEGLAPVSSEAFQQKIEMFKTDKDKTDNDKEENGDYFGANKKSTKKNGNSTDVETSDAADFEDSSSEEEDDEAIEEEGQKIKHDKEVVDDEPEYIGAFDVKKLNKIDTSVYQQDTVSDTGSTEFYKTTDIGGITTATDSGFTSRDITTDDSEYLSSSSDSDSAAESDDELTVNDCVFCYHRSKDSEKNIRHMFTKHGFYIPDRSFLKDLPGLLSFIDYIVNYEEHCLVCEYQGKGIKHHLEKKRHCKIIYETPKQKNLFKDYYDYSTADEVNIKRSNQTPNEVKSIKFAVEESKEDEKDGAKLSKSNSHDKLQKEKKQKDNNIKLERQKRVLTAIDNYKKTDKMYPGVSAKDSEDIVKHMQKMEIRFQYKQTNKSAIRQSNFQMHFRDPLLQ